jgi:hypothetical protein
MVKSRKQRVSKRRFSRKQRGGNPPNDFQTTFIKGIVNQWKKNFGFVKVANSYNYYLSCDNKDDKKHHIHVILTENSLSHRYLYKRNGQHDTADNRGYAFFSDNQNYCMQKGHPAEGEELDIYEYRQWCIFLYNSLCGGPWGECEGNNNNNTMNNNYYNENENAY